MADPIVALSTGILDTISATGGDSLTGDLEWWGRGLVPADDSSIDTTSPCLTWRFPTSNRIWQNFSAGGDYYADIRVQFSVWTRDSDAYPGELIRDKVITLYKDNLLSMTGYRMMSARLREVRSNLNPDGDGWGVHAYIHYEIGTS